MANYQLLVYRKPTITDQYLNYTSNHQQSCKESVASSLLDQAINVASEEKDRKDKITHITNALFANGYEWKMISKVKNKIRRRPTQTEKSTDDETKTTVYLPLIPGTGNILRRVLQEHNIKCVFNSKEML